MKKKNKNSTIKKILVVIIVFILLLAFILVVLNMMNKSDESDDKQETNSIERMEEQFEGKTDEEKIEEIEKADESNRYEFDCDKLKLEGSVEFEGPDFESGSMEFDTYTGLKICNVSDEFLKEADLKFRTRSGDELNVHIEGVKPGQMVFALASDYKGFSPIETFDIVSEKTVYDKEPESNVDGLYITSDAGKISVVNNTGRDIKDCVITYKGIEGEILMGGRIYSLKIDSLKNNETYNAESESFLAKNIEVIEIRY